VPLIRACLLDLGGWQETGPNAEFLDERLPNGKLVVVEAGHFV
jgi:hypothetical protein